MKRLFQIFGGGLGWSLGGPIGALMGVAFGNMMHDLVHGEQADPVAGRQSNRPNSTVGSPSDFHIALLVLAARVIKADGKVEQSELDFVRQQFVGMFGKDRANESFKVFRQIVDQPIPLTKVCNQINSFTTHATRLQLVHFLFKLGLADGHLHAEELEEIRRISRNLRINPYDFASIEAMFNKEQNSGWAFKVLEVTENATEAEVKKAYRKMAMKFHPDRLTDAGPEAQAAAKESFLNVQKAYEQICNQKGWK
jgi:DnaJ like chaperone protein